MSDSARRLADLLIEPHETLDVELKVWLDITGSNEHKAVLAKALLGLANHGGGFVIIGLLEGPTGGVEAPNRPLNLAAYNPNSVNAVVSGYAEPVFHCDVQIVSAPSGLQYPIISVPGGHRVPIRSRRDGPNGDIVKKNCNYIRRLGPQSEPPQSGREWDDLIRRCIANAREEIIDQMRNIFAGPSTSFLARPTQSITAIPAESTLTLTAHAPAGDVVDAANSGTEELQRAFAWLDSSLSRWSELTAALAPENSGRMPFGYFAVSYVLIGITRREAVADLLSAIKRAKISHTGWSEFWVPTREEIRPYPFDGNIECWIARDGEDHGAAHSDFWRVSPDGQFFLVRGFQEDEPAMAERGIAPGTAFDITIPTWRFGEALLHASNMAVQLGNPEATVAIAIEWKGLAGRHLTHLERTRLIFDNRYQSRQDSYRGGIVVRADHISDALPEIVSQVVRPLYELFDFFRLPDSLPAEELARMRSNRF